MRQRSAAQRSGGLNIESAAIKIRFAFHPIPTRSDAAQRRASGQTEGDLSQREGRSPQDRLRGCGNGKFYGRLVAVVGLVVGRVSFSLSRE